MSDHENTLRELKNGLREAPIIKDSQGDVVCLLASLSEKRIAAIDAVLADLARLREDPKTHLCLEPVLRQERDQARRDLDRRDHENAQLRADYEALLSADTKNIAELQRADAEIGRLRAEVEQLRFKLENKPCFACAAEKQRAERLAEVVRDLLPFVTPEPIGRLSGMADRDKRLDWYLEMEPVRRRAEAALAESLSRATGYAYDSLLDAFDAARAEERKRLREIVERVRSESSDENGCMWAAMSKVLRRLDELERQP